MVLIYFLQNYRNLDLEMNKTKKNYGPAITDTFELNEPEKPFSYFV